MFPNNSEADLLKSPREMWNPFSCISFCCCCLVIGLCLTLCDSMDYSLPGSSVFGILYASILEWVAFPFSRGPSQPRDRSQVSRIAQGIGEPDSNPCWAAKGLLPRYSDRLNTGLKAYTHTGTIHLENNFPTCFKSYKSVCSIHPCEINQG